MAVYEISRNIKAHTDVIWNVLSNHDAFTEIAPDIIKVETVSGEKAGMIRRLHHKSGKVWEEKCTAWEDNHYYTMEVDTTSYPLPVNKMTRTCSMKEGQKNTKVTISYKYKPKYRFFGNFMDKHHILPILKLYSNQLMENIARKIYDSEWQYHITVETILKDKGNEFIYVNPETLIGEANKIRHDNRIGSLLVLNENKQIEGILSERDIVNILAETGPEILEKPVSSIMTRNVSVCNPKDDLEKIMT
ncbi:MAG: CBS domain-containing protein [Proteobacteria bacterium]|nr:CBS domain-containing protein [Pseudomonadota bacterium]